MHPDAGWIEAVLVSALWQSSAWLVAGLGGAALLSRRPARAHAVLLVCLLAAALTPAAGALCRLAGWGLLAGTSVSLGVSELAARLGGPDGPPVTSVAGWAHAAALAWLALSAVAGARLLASVRQGRRLLAAAVPLDEGPALCAARRAARALDLDVVPALCVSAALRSPIIWCWSARPRVVLPAGAEGWRDADLFAVLCHELAHVKRRDHLANLAAELAFCALPWHPLAWSARRRVRDLCEQACDAWPIALGASPTRYAETLLGLVPQPALPLVPAASAGGRTLARRLRTILEHDAADPRPGRRWLAALAAAALPLAATAALAHARPPTIEVVSASGDRATLAGPDVITIPPELDLGTAEPGRAARRDVLLCNRSPSSRAVFGASTSCGCTEVLNFEPAILGPGECMAVTVTMTAPREAHARKTRYVTFEIEAQAPLELPVHVQTAP